MTPHFIRIADGRFDLVERGSGNRYQVIQEETGGEGEVSAFQSVRWPKIYYNYHCAPGLSGKDSRIKIDADILRGNRKDWAVDQVQEKMGKMIRFAASLDLQMGEKGIRRLPGKKKRWERAGEPILEINNDHFPTAVFQRRIVPLKDAAGREFLALEENMDPLNLGSIRSERVVKAAAIRGPDRFANLDEVLEETGFFGKLNEACLRTGKKKEDLAIIVKPNFMFMYSTKDRSTFTDPELIEHLIGRMYEKGYRNLACAEARSTYGIEDYLRWGDIQPAKDENILTPREREVLQLIAEGYTNKQIAEILCLSVKTIQAHRANLMQKLDLHDRGELIKYAIQKKIIEV